MVKLYKEYVVCFFLMLFSFLAGIAVCALTSSEPQLNLDSYQKCIFILREYERKNK